MKRLKRFVQTSKSTKFLIGIFVFSVILGIYTDWSSVREGTRILGEKMGFPSVVHYQGGRPLPGQEIVVSTFDPGIISEKISQVAMYLAEFLPKERKDDGMIMSFLKQPFVLVREVVPLKHHDADRVYEKISSEIPIGLLMSGLLLFVLVLIVIFIAGCTTPEEEQTEAIEDSLIKPYRKFGIADPLLKTEILLVLGLAFYIPLTYMGISLFFLALYWFPLLVWIASFFIQFYVAQVLILVLIVREQRRFLEKKRKPGVIKKGIIAKKEKPVKKGSEQLQRLKKIRISTIFSMVGAVGMPLIMGLTGLMKVLVDLKRVQFLDQWRTFLLEIAGFVDAAGKSIYWFTFHPISGLIRWLGIGRYFSETYKIPIPYSRQGTTPEQLITIVVLLGVLSLLTWLHFYIYEQLLMQKNSIREWIGYIVAIEYLYLPIDVLTVIVFLLWMLPVILYGIIVSIPYALFLFALFVASFRIQKALIETYPVFFAGLAKGFQEDR